MKKRIQIDSSILSAIVILTGILYLFPKLYAQNRILDNIFDCLGLILILEGNFFRMAARGHKKSFSQKGNSLVTTGPYMLSRNPMYLGSFLIGSGFVLLVWPWWCLPIFAGLFYVRFNKQILKEEEHLQKHFGDQYRQYCDKVPRLFPSLKNLSVLNINDIINFEELFSTKEKRSLWGWIGLAVVLETFQEFLVLGYSDIKTTLIIFTITLIAYGIGFFLVYKASVISHE